MIIYKTNEPITERVICELVKKNDAENVRIGKMQDYYVGKQGITYRTMADPNMPNNRIVVNYCKYIADFLASYLAGQPVKYVGDNPWLAEMLEANDADGETMDVVTDMNVCGAAVELHYTVAGAARFTNLNPRECIVIMDGSIEDNITGFIRVYPVLDVYGATHYELSYWDDAERTDFILDESMTNLRRVAVYQHYYGMVPVALFKNNKQAQGSFEQVMSMQDALNKVVSDELNDFEAFVDSYLVLEGLGSTTSEDIAQMKQDRVLLLDPDSKAYWLTKTVNNEHVADMQDRLEKRIKELGRVPDTYNDNWGVESGEALKMKLVNTEIQAKQQERGLATGLKRRVELLGRIARMFGFKPQPVDFEFTRNITPTEEESADVE